jgi:Tfp pilus assembly protein PilE
MRARYSTVNSSVKNHSAASNQERKRRFQACTLSATTTATLTRMAATISLSKARPSAVSDSKMISKARRRQPAGGRPSSCWLPGIIRRS